MGRCGAEANRKPGPVLHLDEATAINLGLPLPTGSSGQPESLDEQSSSAFLFDLAPDRVCQAAAVASGAGELLPHLFTIAAGNKFPGRLFVFCGTFLEVTLTPRYGVSCSTEPGLSSLPARKPGQRPPGLLLRHGLGIWFGDMVQDAVAMAASLNFFIRPDFDSQLRQGQMMATLARIVD